LKRERKREKEEKRKERKKGSIDEKNRGKERKERDFSNGERRSRDSIHVIHFNDFLKKSVKYANRN